MGKGMLHPPFEENVDIILSAAYVYFEMCKTIIASLLNGVQLIIDDVFLQHGAFIRFLKNFKKNLQELRPVFRTLFFYLT